MTSNRFSFVKLLKLCCLAISDFISEMAFRLWLAVGVELKMLVLCLYPFLNALKGPKALSHIINFRAFFNVQCQTFNCQFCYFFKNIHIALLYYFCIEQFPQPFSVCTSLTKGYN
ncbi:Os11g0556733 [Oryza sativa Japonica Group]|uniref:Os11g0556733 protein n=1 Tax=Oryza sativa subsp. japonica TaxID=39947 RepID=A0A0P0Y3H4_ORYSJ|nr:hypothetical protein EE612_056133 [Oryza sativa]BAT14451.1 Os11g0556733 [Oryza sativa Japonica Group]